MRPRGTTTLYMISKGNTKRGRRERCDFNRHWNVAYRIVVRRISWGENDIEDVIPGVPESMLLMSAAAAHVGFICFKVLPDSRRRGFSRYLGAAIPRAPPSPSR